MHMTYMNKVKNFNVDYTLQMDHLEDLYQKLHNKIQALKYMFLICMLTIILITMIILYTLKSDIKESIDRLHDDIKETMYQQECHMGRGI